MNAYLSRLTRMDRGEAKIYQQIKKRATLVNTLLNKFVRSLLENIGLVLLISLFFCRSMYLVLYFCGFNYGSRPRLGL